MLSVVYNDLFKSVSEKKYQKELAFDLLYSDRFHICKRWIKEMMPDVLSGKSISTAYYSVRCACISSYLQKEILLDHVKIHSEFKCCIIDQDYKRLLNFSKFLKNHPPVSISKPVDSFKLSKINLFCKLLANLSDSDIKWYALRSLISNDEYNIDIAILKAITKSIKSR